MEINEEVAGQVAQLTQAVKDVQSGLLNRDAVEQIVAELFAQQNAAGNPDGYRPDDHAPDARVITGTFQERMAQIHTRDAGHVASMIRKPADFVREFQERSDDVLILETIMRRGGRVDYDVRSSRFYKHELAPLARAMDTATSTEGQEWVPRELSGDLIRRVNLQLKVAGLFRMIPMPTQPFDLPAVGVTRQRTGSHAQQTADTGQTKFKALTPNTRAVTLTAIKLAARVLVSKEAEEDAIIAILPWIRDEIVEYLAADWEDTILNGDTTATHMDSDTTASDDPRKQLLGLRKLTPAGAKTDVGGGVMTVAALRANRKKMKKYAVDPNKLAHITSSSGIIDLLSDPSVITLDKMGPQATILAGQLASVDGSPIIVSEYVRLDLNATGVFDGTTTTKTETLTVHTGAFIQGERRGITTQYLTELYAESDQDAMVASFRRAFSPLYPLATEPTVALAYNSAA